MKVKTLIFAGIISFLAVANAVEAADKFAYVDLSRIFSEYKKTEDYDKSLQVKEDKYNSDRDKKIADIKQLQDKINLMNEKEQESKKGDLEEKIKAVQEFDRQQQTDLRKEQNEKMKEILKDIEEVVGEYAEKEGLTMVFNDRVLVYQDKKLDITNDIIKSLNSRNKAAKKSKR